MTECSLLRQGGRGCTLSKQNQRCENDRVFASSLERRRPNSVKKESEIKTEQRDGNKREKFQKVVEDVAQMIYTDLSKRMSQKEIVDRGVVYGFFERGARANLPGI